MPAASIPLMPVTHWTRGDTPVTHPVISGYYQSREEATGFQRFSSCFHGAIVTDKLTEYH